MKYILQTDNETIEIPIIRSKRKTLGLEVKYDGTVNARVPMRAPREIIERFIREHGPGFVCNRESQGPLSLPPACEVARGVPCL